MTNAEAIQVLQRTAWLGGDTYGLQNRAEQVEEAIRMAITALQELDKNPTKPNNSNEKVNNSNNNSNNSINNSNVTKDNSIKNCDVRQEAISRIQNAYMDTQGGKDRAAVNINVGLTKALHIMQDMPFAQPDSKELSSTHKALDTISRQAAIEINQSYHGQMPNEVNHRIWKEINELPSVQPEPHWIPVSERLPEDEQLVLVTYKTTDRIHVCQYHEDGSRNQWYSLNDMCRAHNNVVLAWIPLPKPYREEGENR